MALPTRPPPSPITPVKREHDATELAAAGAHTPLPPQPPKKLRPDHPETPTQPLLTRQTVSSNTLLPSAHAAMKTEPFADEVSSKSHATPPGVPSAASPPPPPTSDNRETEADEKATRVGPPRARPARNSAAGATIAVNRRRLGRLLRELVRLHRWREAAAAVSALIAATPRPASFDEARSTFVAAMDIQRRLDEDSGKQQHSKSRYFLRTQKLFDVWMRRLNWLPTCPGKHLVKLELALFHLSQGNIDNAYNATRTLLFKEELKTEPTLNLIHGLISYEKWYSGLPKDMQVEDYDVYKQSSTVSMVSNCHEEIGSLESSDDNCGINIDDASFSICSSRSSIGNGKSAPNEFNRNIIKKSNFVEKSDSSGSQMIERMDASDLRSVFFNSSNTRTCGLEINLLPLRLKHVVGTSDDCFDSYLKYKSAPNAFYNDAEKCLRRALHSRPPLIAALLPLIQLLLLGDKLKDALNELEKTCHSLTTALPFRLRGRLLEYADQSQVLTISSCYEEALRRDPTCSYSMERLIKMHIKGYYNTIQLLEMIALHLDSSNGKPCIWEELVSCFLRLFSDRTLDYEDRISCNAQDVAFTTFSKFSSVFIEQHTRESWKVRCRWWKNHHFSKRVYSSEIQTGDCKLLASKAACASHIFGSEFQYVEAVKNSLLKQGARDEMRFLSRHMQSSVGLLQTLEKLAS